MGNLKRKPDALGNFRFAAGNGRSEKRFISYGWEKHGDEIFFGALYGALSPLGMANYVRDAVARG